MSLPGRMTGTKGFTPTGVLWILHSSHLGIHISEFAGYIPPLSPLVSTSTTPKAPVLQNASSRQRLRRFFLCKIGIWPGKNGVSQRKKSGFNQI